MKLYPYCQCLEDCNEALAEADKYFLYPGMEFRSSHKWWPDSGSRPTPHEGVDLCYFGDSAGTVKQFTAQTRVPAMAAGKIYAMCRDFLGKTVFLDHELDAADRFLSIYAHIIPIKTVVPGQKVRQGEVIGHIADTAGRKNRMPAHLHLSIMRVAKEVRPQDFSWKAICSSAYGELLDPLKLIRTDKIERCRHNQWKERLMNKNSG